MPRKRDMILILVVVRAILAIIIMPPVSQPPDYHLFADSRAFSGVPNFFDVVSNLPFALIGIFGLAAVAGRNSRTTPMFADRWERWPWLILFIGVALTVAGSSWYHLAPDNARLVWDRLPITVGLMGFLCAVIAERLSVTIARMLLIPLLVAGAASVAFWYWGEVQGHGDLRFYILIQFGSLLVIILLLALYPARQKGTAYIVAALLFYGAAKALEATDARVFALGNLVSGHTLKHLAAAAGVASLAAMLQKRGTANRRKV